ncbi:MAG: hypothetical protein QW177_08040 [Candidatus Nitrosotenuis sp.]
MEFVLWQHERSYWIDQERSEHQKVLDLLDNIKEKWSINYKVDSGYDSDQVYREMFLKNNRILSRDTGKSIRGLRTRQGKGSPILDGVLGVFDNNRIIYYIESYDGRDQFLERILEEGPSHIEKIISKNSTDTPEEKLVKNFLNKAAEYGFAGQMHQEYLLARPVEDNSSEDPELKNFKKAFSYVSGKSIDLLHERDDGTFDIIEAKTKLNWSAVGQAIGYKQIFCRLNNISLDKVRSNIVCNQSDGFVEYVCDELGIKVIVFS